MESSLEDWLALIRENIAAGYTPSSCEVLDYPKPGFQVRPASRLDLRDAVVYFALGQYVVRAVRDSLAGLANIDYSYVLRSGESSVPWFRRRFDGWKNFHQMSLKRIDRGATHVVFADVVGYYENVDLSRLRNMLLGAGLAEDILELLIRCLRKWAGSRGRGIPQGVSVSDLLAKVYLEPLDRRLRRAGFEHLRYVDDVRIFCGSHNEAKFAIRELSALMRERGLNLQSAKTKICDVAAARKEIEGAVPTIEALEKALVKKASAQVGWVNPYIYPEDLRAMRQELEEGATREAIETAFKTQVLRASQFDSSLFHYTLNRLGAVGSRVAVDFALAQLVVRPEETEALLRYLAALGSSEKDVNRMLKCLGSGDIIYEFQCFQVLRWLYEQQAVPCRDGVLDYARTVAKERSKPFWLRGYALALLGDHGDDADRETLEELYDSSVVELEKAVIVCALRGVHKARRNAFYARVRGDGFLVASAVRWVQNQSGQPAPDGERRGPRVVLRRRAK